MAESTKKYFDIVMAQQTKVLMIYHSAHVFFASLASYRLFRETGESLWAERAKQLHSKIDLWSKEGSDWNYEHKLDLLNAEEQYSCSTGGDSKSAEAFYAKAIKNALKHKFINDAALASERAADFYRSNGNMPTAFEHYTRAHALYSEWGARAKAASLLEFIKSKTADG